MEGMTARKARKCAFLPKPFTIRQLTERVREVLDS